MFELSKEMGWGISDFFVLIGVLCWFLRFLDLGFLVFNYFKGENRNLYVFVFLKFDLNLLIVLTVK